MKILLISLLVFSAHLFGQSVRDDLDNPDFNQMRQEGQIFSVELSKGKPLKISVVGREEASFDLKNLKLKVNRLEQNREIPIQVFRRNGYFILPDNISPEDVSKLSVTPTMNGKSETFEFKLR